MPKAAMTIAQLEQHLEKRKALLNDLRKRHESLLAGIAEVNEQIASLMGSTTAAPEKAPPVERKAGKTLRESVLEVLKASPRPMTTREIAEAVTKAGYKSTSKNFVTLERLFCYKSDELQRKGKGKLGVKGKK